jgi:hypothetical protein
MLNSDAVKYVTEFLVSQQKHKQAHELLDAFKLQATNMVDYDILGAAALRSQYHSLRLECAIYVYTHSITREQLFVSRENLYKTYNALNYPELALFYIELNLKIKPNDSETLTQKAFNLALLNKRIEAENIIINVAATDPKVQENINYSLSNKLMREGHTAKGIVSFITAFKPDNDLFKYKLKLKFWDGGIQPGRTIVIVGEGGVGDEIINIRFLDHLKRLGMHPILYSSWYKYRPDTIDLFRRHGYEVTTNHFFFRKDYLWTYMMSLPGYLGLTESQLWKGPYLTPLRNLKNNLKDINFKVGIKCSGNPFFEQDIYRCIPIDQILNIIPKSVSTYYIDTEKTHSDTINLKDRITCWEDTLDFIDQMDIIITSCTSLAHIAGAMGKRTIVIVPIAEYYTWTSTRTNETTPWYGDNFTVLKQIVPRSWNEPLLKAKNILNNEYQLRLTNM